MLSEHQVDEFWVWSDFLWAGRFVECSSDSYVSLEFVISFEASSLMVLLRLLL